MAVFNYVFVYQLMCVYLFAETLGFHEKGREEDGYIRHS